jgi:hypothetical protein
MFNRAFFVAFLATTTVALSFWGPTKPDGFYIEPSFGLGVYNFRKDGTVYFSPQNKANTGAFTLRWRLKGVTDEMRRLLPREVSPEYLIVVEWPNRSENNIFSILCFVGDDLLDVIKKTRYNNSPNN